jgi:hypothetical protein
VPESGARKEERQKKGRGRKKRAHNKLTNLNAKKKKRGKIPPLMKSAQEPAMIPLSLHSKASF